MTEYLKQDQTGRVYVKTETFAQREDMKPYEWPADPKDDGWQGQPSDDELTIGAAPPRDLLSPSREKVEPSLDEIETGLNCMTKDQLCEYALNNHGITLSKRKIETTLVGEIMKLERARA
ncbi:MAG: hypothetical protein JEZ12_15990 [Desulfobacterium sp.]|nr:hypothetical protein [Desulfobacterium sp.]